MANRSGRKLVSGEVITVPAAVTQMITLLAAAAANAMTNVIGIYNADPAETLYAAAGSAAPASTADMIPIQPGQGFEFHYGAAGAANIYVATSAAVSQKARVHQEYESNP